MVTFKDWYTKKRLMFAPIEYDALQKGDVLMTEIARRIWQDDETGRPRRRVILFTKAAEISHDTSKLDAKELSPYRKGDFGAPCSSTGKKPVTHYMSNWNCSATEYDILVGKFTSLTHTDRACYNGDKFAVKEVLGHMNLKIIKLEDSIGVTNGK